MHNEVKLTDLIAKIPKPVEVKITDENKVCSSLEYDSRKVKKDSIFVAVKGIEVDGHNYINDSIKKGASVIVVDQSRKKDFADLPAQNVSIIVVEDSRFALSYFSAAFYDFVTKKVPVIGVTGTNGKTSITYMLEAIFKQAGLNPGVIGTIDYRWNDVKIPAPNTTPESKDLHEIMYNMHNDGVNVIVMEVSSHGLGLGRVDNVEFKAAAFTNLTRDHLDFHKTFDEYFSAKKVLFHLLENSEHKERFAVINIDDEYGEELLKYCSDFTYKSFSYAKDKKANYKISNENIINTIDGISYFVETDSNKYKLDLHLSGKFNLYNSITAFAVAEQMKINTNDIVKALTSIQTIPGRFDRIKTKLGFSVIVDYAHTDDALVKLLSSVKELNAKKIITVFGCGGERDNSKRPLMGKAAIEYSDFVIITSDNPRKEDPEKIVADIENGIAEHKSKYHVEIDREKAIKEAINKATESDIVVIAGKGHENYQVLGKEKIHFDDNEIARKYIAKRENK